MKLLMLLVGSSVAAGAHLVLFIASSIIAWIYFRRFKRLRAHVAQQGLVPADDANEAGQRRESNAGLARGDQPEQRQREQRMIAALYALNETLPRDRGQASEPTKQATAEKDNGGVLEEEERAHHTS